MKKKLSTWCALAGVCYMSLLFNGCKKNDAPDVQRERKLVELAHKWYTDTLLRSNAFMQDSRYARRMKALNNLLDWQQAEAFYSNGMSYVVMPVKHDNKPFMNRSFEASQSIVFYVDNAHHVQIKLVEVVSNRDVSLNNQATAITRLAFLQSQSHTSDAAPGMNANVVVYDGAYKREKSYAVKNGRLYETGFKLQQQTFSNKEQAALRGGYWETWYLVGIYYDVDTGEVISVNVLNTYQQCVGDCDTWGTIDEPGGSGSGVDDCVASTYTNASLLSDGVTEVAELEKDNASDLDPIRKNRELEWKILRGPTWALHSHEHGVVRLEDPRTNTWVWESLTHGSITMSGMLFGGGISFTQGEGTPSFVPGTPNVLYAGMSLRFNVTFSPLNNCPGFNLIFPPYTLPYTSNAIWPAKP